MLELGRVGLLLRDQDQEYPLDEVREIFAAHPIEVALIELTVSEHEAHLLARRVSSVGLIGGGVAALVGGTRRPPCRGRPARAAGSQLQGSAVSSSCR